MMTELVPFSEYVDFINGDRGKNYPKEKDYVDKGIPFISAKDLEKDLDDSSSFNNYISKESYEKLRSGKVENGDILFCLRGSVGKHSFVNSLDMAAIASSLVIIRAKQDIEKRFIHYLLNDSSVKRLIQSYENGSVQGNLSVKDLSGVLVPYIDNNIQRDISKFLELFDRKIELNKKMNTVLQQITSTLFKSWFIDFDPVRAKLEEKNTGLSKEISDLFPDEFEDSGSGKIPKGWSAGALGDILVRSRDRVGDTKVSVLTAVNSGKLVLSEEYFSKQVFSKNISKYIKVEHHDFAYNPSRINIGSIGMNENTFVGAVSPAYIVFKPSDSWHWYISQFIKLKSTNSKINQLSSGSVRQSLSFDDLASIPITIPKDPVIKEFNKIYETFKSQITQNEKENEVLNSLRDTLLPKLIYGELQIPDVENLVEETGI